MAAIVYRHIAQILAEFDAPGKKVLELGCGAMPYRALVQGQYSGLDLPNSTHFEPGKPKPEFLCSAEKIPCDGDQFDLVFGVGTFYLMPPVDQVFAEAHRVLKPGGALLVFDYDLRVLRKLSEAKHVWDFETLRKHLQRAGFRTEGVRRISEFGYAPVGPRWKQWLNRILNRPSWQIVAATK